jgi:hypothetical protein
MLMRESYIFTTAQRFTDEFIRCCNEYKHLHLAVAWCGNPNQILPYQYLTRLTGVIATVGISFNHTHPDAIEWLDKVVGADIRIFRDDGDLFHPKVYLFRDNDRYALFIGSSNLTYGGFYANVEASTLIEGTATHRRRDDILMLEETLAEWHSDLYSQKPTAQWLQRYRKVYGNTVRRERKHGIYTPPRNEEGISTSWLCNATWDVYYGKVVEGLKEHGRKAQDYHDVLDAASRILSVPWKVNVFEDIETRRIISGIKKYGLLGHIASSGRFKHLLANGSRSQWKTICRAINHIARLHLPIPWSKLERILNDLFRLRFTMKVWGRLLCIVRPDIYCTVASPSVRVNLATTLSVPQKEFERPNGYIQLIKLIHDSPWFNSSKPPDKEEAAVWNRRVAFMDVIFYDD